MTTDFDAYTDRLWFMTMKGRKDVMRKLHILTISLTAVVIVTAAFVLVPADIVSAKGTCVYKSCNNTAIDGGVYCSSHTCVVSGCNILRYSDSCSYCYKHRCEHKGCTSKRVDGSNFCSTHKKEGEAAVAELIKKNGLTSGTVKKVTGNSSSGGSTTKSTTTTKSSSSGSVKTVKKAATSSARTTGSSGTKKSTKKYDIYDVYSYKDAQSFADDRYEEFFDYEDDYEDEDEAYDAAEDYWREHHEE